MKFRSLLAALTFASLASAGAAAPAVTPASPAKKPASRVSAKAKPAVQPLVNKTAAAVVPSATPTPEMVDGLAWYSPVDGFKLAEKLNKPVLVDVYTDWCGWCKVMDRTTFPDPAVSKILTDNFVLVKANAEDGAAGTDIAKQVGVQSFPTSLFFNSNRTLIAATFGFRKPEVFAEMLKRAIAINAQFRPGMKPTILQPTETSEPVTTNPSEPEGTTVKVTNPATATP